MPTKGRKSISWKKDPEILRRLAAVASMMLRGAKPWQIWQSYKDTELDSAGKEYSLRTAYRDITRVRSMWAEAAKGEVEDKRVQSIAQIRLVQYEAWDNYYGTDKKTKKKPSSSDQKKPSSSDQRGWLKIIMETEAQIIALEATQPRQRVDVTTDGEQLNNGLVDGMAGIFKLIGQQENPQPLPFNDPPDPASE